MIHYPLSTLVKAGGREVLVITNPEYIALYKEILEDGSKFNIKIEYASQSKPDGLPDAIRLAKDFIGDAKKFLVILGDNYFSSSIQKYIEDGLESNTGASVFLTNVDNPSNFGIVSLDEYGRIERIEEKTKVTTSNLATTGLYIFSNDVFQKIELLAKSERGELEIVDLLNIYKEEDRFKGIRLDKQIKWFDMGTHESLEEIDRFLKSEGE